jgi:hypothetical protein
MKRLRGIWAEGTIWVMKRWHNLMRIGKRGLSRVKEECLLSALALNLKRMVKAAMGSNHSLLFQMFSGVFYKNTIHGNLLVM